MAQIYKISVNKAFLYISDTARVPGIANVANLQAPKDAEEWHVVLQRLLNGEGGEFLIKDRQAGQVFLQMKQSVSYLEAAGGLVRNGLGEVLLIYRMQHWDLPKGKIEPNDSALSTALREVAEETGLNNLVAGDRIMPYPWQQEGTLHLYVANGILMLKLTHWFEMWVPNRPELRPQASEVIESALWVNVESLPEYIRGAYPNIADLLEDVL